MDLSFPLLDPVPLLVLVVLFGLAFLFQRSAAA